MAKCIEEGCTRQAIDGERQCGRHKAFTRSGRPLRQKRIERYPWQKLYSTAKWSRLRHLKMSTNSLCELCGDVGQHVDHIVPHKGNERLFYRKANLQTLCIPCHTKKTNAERWLAGLPLADYKLTFVTEDFPISHFSEKTIIETYGKDSKLIFIANQMAKSIVQQMTNNKRKEGIIYISKENIQLQYQITVEAQYMAKHRIEVSYA